MRRAGLLGGTPAMPRCGYIDMMKCERPGRGLSKSGIDGENIVRTVRRLGFDARRIEGLNPGDASIRKRGDEEAGWRELVQESQKKVTPARGTG